MMVKFYFTYNQICKYVSLFACLRLLIEYTKDSDEPSWKGYFYACLLFSTAILQSLVLQHYFHRSFLLGMHLKTAIISLVYNKVIGYVVLIGGILHYVLMLYSSVSKYVLLLECINGTYHFRLHMLSRVL